MTERLSYRVVDVFTDRAFAGNPLAVVLDSDGLTTAQMQAIAREFNLSETTFPSAPTAPDADYRVRIFTPQAELPFAGHPSVGTACVLRELGRIADGDLVQECGAGLLPVVVRGDSATLTGGAPHLGDPLDAGDLAAALALTDSDVAGPAGVAGVGIDFAYLPVHDDALARAVPDIARLAGMPVGTGTFVFSYEAGEVHARMFATGVGVFEDPATGSAALALGVWLAAQGVVAGDAETAYVVEQGREMGRPSRLSCVVRCENGRAVETRVTGSVAPVAEGTIRVP